MVTNAKNTPDRDHTSLSELVETLRSEQLRVAETCDEIVTALSQVDRDHALVEAIFDESRDAIFVADGPSRRILKVNEAAGAMAGCKPDHLIGRFESDLHPDEANDFLCNVFEAVRRKGGVKSMDGLLRRLDGELVPVSMSANVIHIGDQEFVVGVARDISERIDMEKKLFELNTNLETMVDERTRDLDLTNQELEKTIHQANRNALDARSANEAKSNFIANMSHEIRTPLNAVIGMTDLLLDMALGEEERETAEIVARSARNLNGLISDILDFSKIEAGKIELENAIFKPSDLIEDIVKTLDFQAREKDLDLRLCSVDLPEYLIGDPGRLRQILVNLIGNALKFTEAGSVELRATPSSSLGTKVAIDFEVQDTGIGIATEILPTLFQAFTQADASTTRKYGGTGLGLKISSELVAKMGGRLLVESEEGVGSTFSFNAQFDTPTVHQIAEVVARETGFEIAARGTAGRLAEKADEMRILLVEDNIVNQRVGVGMLAKLGFAPQVAGDGQEALEMLERMDFDLVFMDLQMPILDGAEATRNLRAGQAGELNRNVPIIAMTAHATSHDRRNCLAAGMNDYIPKPISSDQVYAAMLRVLHATETGSAPVSIEPKPYRLDDLVEKLDGDFTLATEIIDVFLVDTRARIGVLKLALARYDFLAVREEAHTVKSGALNVNAEEIASLAMELMQSATDQQGEFAASLVEDIAAELEQIETALPTPR